MNKWTKTLTTIFCLLLPSVALAEETTAYNDTLFSKQWPLINSGQTILRRSGELNREKVEGVPGMDINWLSPSEVAKLNTSYNIPKDREIVVAVLDSGLDIEHPDLKGRVYFDKTLCPDGEDNSEKPCLGINVLKKNSDLTDDTGHGTHVAGIIAGVGNNNLGIQGVTDSRIKILPIKVLSKDTTDFIYEGRLITDVFADGIFYAVQRGAKVINMSIGWPKVVETPKIRRALKFAEENNVIVIAAAGNNNKEIPTFPCTNETVICVGAVDNQGKITEFSNFGGKVDLLAPGEFIVSTYPRESVESRILRIIGYETKNGTSQASPFVAAIAASMKLLKPEISNDELKARLFSSAKPLAQSLSDGKFTKYGMVDMKEAVLAPAKPFVMPVFKDLLDLNYDVKDGSFFFGLPIKSLVGNFEDLKIKIAFNRSDIEMESTEQVLSLKEGDKRPVLFKGKLKDLSKDTHFRLKVTLEHPSFTSETETTLIFARNLSRENGVIKEEIKGFDANELTFFRGVRKAIRVKKVADAEGWFSAPIFYLERPKNNNDAETVISLVKRVGQSWEGQDIKLPKKHEVVGVRATDLNLDGEVDFLVTAVNKNQDRITFDYLYQKEGKLLDKETFNFPLLEYERFPIEYNDFGSLLLLARKVGDRILKVPAFYEAYTMPEADNTYDILDRVPEDLRAYHLYFLNPKVVEGEKQMELRVVDSLTQIEEIREQADIPMWLPITLEKPFPQSQEDRRQGVLRGLIAAGEEFERDYHAYKIKASRNASGVSLRSVFFEDRFVSGNNVRPLLSLETSSLGVAKGKVEFLAQLKRDQVRSYVWSPETLAGQSLLLDTKKWSDPVFNTIASYEDENRTRLIETRYFIQAFGQKGEPGRLRINRESSFPGVQFSETLEEVAVRGNEENHPGVFINSTLIFGNRLYTMVEKEQEFLRPLIFSVDIPKSCVHMKPAKIDGVYNYLMLCRKSQGRIELQRLPLVLP